MQELIDQIKQRVQDPVQARESSLSSSRLNKPANALDIHAAEQQLGFQLPEFLRRLYSEVGNGGFGPGYGLIGIANGADDDQGKDIIQLYKIYRQPDPDDKPWDWPEKVVPICNFGCAMYACIDCKTEEGAMIWFEPNPHLPGESWDDSFIPLSNSLAAWIQAWLEGRDYLKEAWERKFRSGENGFWEEVAGQPRASE